MKFKKMILILKKFRKKIICKKNEKNFFCKRNPLCLWKIFSVYEISFVWHVLSMKCPLLLLLLNRTSGGSMKCPIYEMSYLWNVFYMILLSMKFLSIKCHNAREEIWKLENPDRHRVRAFKHPELKNLQNCSFTVKSK